MSREITLSSGQVALVDDDDFERVNRYTWCLSQGRVVGYMPDLYAKHGKPGGSLVLLHRFVLGLTEAGHSWRVLHVNGNKLDNRTENLFDPKTCRQHHAETGTKHLPLRPGICAVVDEQDFDWLNRWKWSPHKHGKDRWAAIRYHGKTAILLHRQIMQPADDVTVDHRDRDPLNNRRDNLRFATQAQQALNRRANLSNKTSRYKGVSWLASNRKWRVWFREKHIGLFDNEVDAAMAYDRAAEKFDPDFACLNFPVRGGLSAA